MEKSLEGVAVANLAAADSFPTLPIDGLSLCGFVASHSRNTNPTHSCLLLFIYHQHRSTTFSLLYTYRIAVGVVVLALRRQATP